MSCFCSFIKWKSSRDQDLFDGNRDIEGIGNTATYSYKELRKATSDFSCKIGEGGFGSVYKGRLKDGRDVAVKVLSTESRQGVKEFFTEVKVLSGIVHENLVRVYGCCVEGDHRILVYNYLENNSLAQTLLGSGSSGQSNIHFNWRTRVKICLGIAMGLAYLHEEVDPHIVHRDIKASNILLDKDLNPKISDFGLARLLPPNTTHVSTRVAGTFGYLAPEYAIRGQVTRKSDVYSFGVLLMEIVSGRSNTNMKLPYEEQLLLEKTWSLFQRGELEKIIDPCLYEDLDKEEACRFLKVGLLCTQDITKLRPTMTTALRMLKGELDIDSTQISKPAIIQDFMQVKLTGQRPPISSLGMASSSDESTRVSLTFTAITDRE
ncbi:cold-responsive protein kinase 1-like isoform X3 [Carex rostrata]